jgi:hypothetical protein
MKGLALDQFGHPRAPKFGRTVKNVLMAGAPAVPQPNADANDIGDAALTLYSRSKFPT